CATDSDTDRAGEARAIHLRKRRLCVLSLPAGTLHARRRVALRPAYGSMGDAKPISPDVGNSPHRARSGTRSCEETQGLAVSTSLQSTICRPGLDDAELPVALQRRS